MKRAKGMRPPAAAISARIAATSRGLLLSDEGAEGDWGEGRSVIRGIVPGSHGKGPGDDDAPGLNPFQNRGQQGADTRTRGVRRSITAPSRTD